MKNPRILFENCVYAIEEIVPTPSFTAESDGIPYKGMRVEFENGRIISIQAHWSNYCTIDYKTYPLLRFAEQIFLNRHYRTSALGLRASLEHWYNAALTVEIATWGVDMPGLQQITEYDTVVGHVTENELQRFAEMVLEVDKRHGFVVDIPYIHLYDSWREDSND